MSAAHPQRLHADQPQAYDRFGGEIHLLPQPSPCEVLTFDDEISWPNRVGRAPMVEAICTFGLLDPIPITDEVLEYILAVAEVGQHTLVLADDREVTRWYPSRLRDLYCEDCLAAVEP